MTDCPPLNRKTGGQRTATWEVSSPPLVGWINRPSVIRSRYGQQH